MAADDKANFIISFAEYKEQKVSHFQEKPMMS